MPKQSLQENTSGNIQPIDQGGNKRVHSVPKGSSPKNERIKAIGVLTHLNDVQHNSHGDSRVSGYNVGLLDNCLNIFIVNLMVNQLCLLSSKLKKTLFPLLETELEVANWHCPQLGRHNLLYSLHRCQMTTSRLGWGF